MYVHVSRAALTNLFSPQEEHWKIEPISKEEREAEQAKQAEQVCWNVVKPVFRPLSCVGK